MMERQIGSHRRTSNAIIITRRNVTGNKRKRWKRRKKRRKKWRKRKGRRMMIPQMSWKEFPGRHKKSRNLFYLSGSNYHNILQEREKKHQPKPYHALPKSSEKVNIKGFGHCLSSF